MKLCRSTIVYEGVSGSLAHIHVRSPDSECRAFQHEFDIIWMAEPQVAWMGIVLCEIAARHGNEASENSASRYMKSCFGSKTLLLLEQESQESLGR